MSQPWTVVIPVKALGAAKTRMGDDVVTRRKLARAMFIDTATAAMHSTLTTDVIVSTQGKEIAALAELLGAKVHWDRGDGLNQALTVCVDHFARDRHVVAMLADLPSLTSAGLDTLLSKASAQPIRRQFVPDASGTGTTMVMSRTAQQFRSSFGPMSAHLHRYEGFYEHSDAQLTTRTDVDTWDELVAAQALGLGQFTRDVIEDSGGVAALATALRRSSATTGTR